jgi:O-phosphoseryl-tRNA(Cys) synthetase
VIKNLIDGGIKVEKIRKIFEFLKDGLDEDVTQVNLVISGNKTVLVQSGDELVDLLKQGQGVLNILPLAAVKEEVDSAIIDLRPVVPNEEISTHINTGS